MNGLVCLLLLAMGFAGGFWCASVFRLEDERTLDEYRRRKDRWSD